VTPHPFNERSQLPNVDKKILKAPYLRNQAHALFNGINELREPTIDNYIHQHMTQSKTKSKQLIRKRRHINFMKYFDFNLKNNPAFKAKFQGLNLFDQKYFKSVCRQLSINWVDGRLDCSANVRTLNLSRIHYINLTNHEEDNLCLNHSLLHPKKTPSSRKSYTEFKGTKYTGPALTNN
jgi:hypothetical protein